MAPPTPSMPTPASGGPPGGGKAPSQCPTGQPGDPIPDPESDDDSNVDEEDDPEEGTDPLDHNPAFVPDEDSEAPVRYFDGVINSRMVDLASDGFGSPWTQTRSWTN